MDIQSMEFSMPEHEWVAFPFSKGFSQPRDQTQVSRIAGRFFTSWATKEAQPIPSPGAIPDPGIELGSSALQVDSLPTELSGKPQMPGSGHKINDEKGEVKILLCFFADRLVRGSKT